MVKIVNTIYKSEKVGFETGEKDYRYVKAEEEIWEGEILLVEHCLCVEEYECMRLAIIINEELFKNLYPRKECETEEEKEELCLEKIKKNVFGREGKYLLGLDVSRINNSRTPNATVKYFGDLGVVYGCNLSYVYANKKIEKGEEICIWYGKGYFGEEEICEKEFEIGTEEIKERYNLYRKSERCKEIMFRHTIIYYGVYVDDDAIYRTEKFKRKVKENGGKEVDDEYVEGWIERMREKIKMMEGV
jgi:hypothetical protein